MIVATNLANYLEEHVKFFPDSQYNALRHGGDKAEPVYTCWVQCSTVHYGLVSIITNGVVSVESVDNIQRQI